MPNQLTLLPTPGTLPIGTCYPDEQSRLNGFAALLPIIFPSSFAGVVVSATKPADITQTWFQLDTFGRPVRLYQFAVGSWLSQHPLPPGFVMIWIGPLPDFTGFDGGDGSATSDTTGPMWQSPPQDGSGNATLVAQVPLGTGTLPSGKVVAAGTTGGEENHVLSVAELALHTHNTALIQTNLSAASGTTPTLCSTTLTGSGVTQTPTDNGSNTGIAGNGHNTLPPYYGVSFLQRTARLFYAVN
jgi:hypothetical protein